MQIYILNRFQNIHFCIFLKVYFKHIIIVFFLLKNLHIYLFIYIYYIIVGESLHFFMI